MELDCDREQAIDKHHRWIEINKRKRYTNTHIDRYVRETHTYKKGRERDIHTHVYI